MKTLWFTAASLALLFAGFANTASGKDARKQDVQNSAWSVEQINGVTPTALATIKFGPEYRLSGTTGCNPFFGIYGVDGNTVVVRTVAAADNPCDAAAAQQAMLLQVLRDEPTISVEQNGKLSISGKSRGVVILAPSQS